MAVEGVSDLYCMQVVHCIGKEVRRGGIVVAGASDDVEQIADTPV